MAQSNELGKTQIVTRDGIVTATVFDTVSPDTMSLHLTKGAASARYGGLEDETALVKRDVKDLIVFPFSEL
jgi:hypothetical protein